jgi:hypothetical protein
MVTGMLRDHLKQDLLTLESWTDFEDCAVPNSFMEMFYAKPHQQRCKLTKGVSEIVQGNCLLGKTTSILECAG